MGQAKLKGKTIEERAELRNKLDRQNRLISAAVSMDIRVEQKRDRKELQILLETEDSDTEPKGIHHAAG